MRVAWRASAGRDEGGATLMSSLGMLLGPGERESYRSQASWKLVLWRSFLYICTATFATGLLWLNTESLDTLHVVMIAQIVLLTALFHIIRDRQGTNILLTNRRLMFHEGPFVLKKVQQIKGTDIERMSLSWWKWPTSVFVRSRSGRWLKISRVAEPADLVPKIAELAGCPSPKRPRLNFGVACLLTEMLALSFLLLFAVVYFRLESGVLESLIPALNTIPSSFEIVLFIVESFLGFLGPLALAYLAGRQVSVILIRWLLDAEEAREFLAQQPDMAIYGRFFAAVGRTQTRLMEATLTLLYGQPIRRSG